MIANIRVLTDGNSRSLCQLDLMKFSKEAVLAGRFLFHLWLF